METEIKFNPVRINLASIKEVVAGMLEKCRDRQAEIISQYNAEDATAEDKEELLLENDKLAKVIPHDIVWGVIGRMANYLSMGENASIWGFVHEDGEIEMNGNAVGMYIYAQFWENTLTWSTHT